jgi:hypothetical protein
MVRVCRVEIARSSSARDDLCRIEFCSHHDTASGVLLVDWLECHRIEKTPASVPSGSVKYHGAANAFVNNIRNVCFFLLCRMFVLPLTVRWAKYPGARQATSLRFDMR